VLVAIGGGGLIGGIGAWYEGRTRVVGVEPETNTCMTRRWDEVRVFAEPGGAAALAALLSGAGVAEPGEHVVVLVCGANGDLSAIASPVRRAPDLRRTLP
jgi:threonine dehydratase